MAETPSLYGIKNSNRNFNDPHYWGKNQFNSSFPIALACYMRDLNIPAKYIQMNAGLDTEITNIPISTLFNTTIGNEELTFQFESRYKPFDEFVHDELETIDCVVMHGETYLRPIEIKLTTLPDQTTFDKSDAEYGSEIVVRSATMRYLALSMAESLKSEFSEINKLFVGSCKTIRNWDNSAELKGCLGEILDSLDKFYEKYYTYQKPLLMQPVWKTIGKSAELAENCLDIFVWSDFALTKLFMDSAKSHTGSKISRHQRAALRLARFLFEVSRGGEIFQAPIYDGMSLGNQTDKEFSLSGVKTNSFMACDRLTTPVVTKSEIKNIILGGGQKYLSPERRFDAIIYFSEGIFE